MRDEEDVGNREQGTGDSKDSSRIPHPSSLYAGPTPNTRYPTPVQYVLAIDPGMVKCGVAVVQADGQVMYRGIVPTETIVEQAQILIAAHQPLVLVCGNGTGSKPILQALQAAQLTVPIEPVDEAHTSEAARARFIRENRPPLLQRLLPITLRTPWLPYDDYVAVILAERYWQAAPERNNSQPEPII